MTKNPLLIILVTIGTLLQVSPAPLHALTLGTEGLAPASVSTDNESVSNMQEADLDGNGTRETLELTRGSLTIHSGKGTAWQSPSDWQVVQAAITDLNLDGHPEVAVLLWRPFRPWPVDKWLPNGGRIAGFHNTQGQSCQIILIGWKGTGYGELWAGSPMADPILSLAAADLDGDNQQELVALEGWYSDPPSVPAHTLKIWKWNGFGFTVVSFIEGNFGKITLVKAEDSRILILVP